MTSINKVLKQFSNLLVSCWSTLIELAERDTSGPFKDDWLQANWELIIEGLLDDKNIVLETYGDGADCNGESSRVLYPDRLPTHRLVCSALEGRDVYDVLNKKSLDLMKNDIIFDRFVSIGDDGWYYELPPFDKALCEHGGEMVVLDFDSVDIRLKPLREN